MTNRFAFRLASTHRTSAAFGPGGHEHRLESLEGRSLLSAGCVVDASEATQLTPVVAVADASFLNASSDPAAEAGPGATDADMYDFGGAWGARTPQQAGGAQDRSDIDMAFSDDFGPRGSTPADVLGRAPVVYGDPAPYGTTTPIITNTFDPVPDDAPMPGEPEAAVAKAPETPTAPEPIVAAPAAQSSVVSAPAVGAWIDVPQTWAQADKASPAMEQVVIASTFLQ